MALPSSGAISLQAIGTELGVNAPFSLADMSVTAGFTPPYAMTSFYGYGGVPDVVTSGLQLYLDAGQNISYSGTGSTWYDLSGNANNATLVNSPTFNTSDGGNLTFPYSNVYGQINDSASLQFGTGDFTISIWEYPQVVDDGGNQRTILSKNYTGFEIFIYQSILRGYFGGVNQLQGTTTLTANTWYNFVFVRSAGVITSYINTIQDGQLVNSTDVSNIGTGLFVNIRPSSSLYGEENISNILLYNRALTNSEVIQNYNAFASRYGYTPLPNGIVTTNLILNLDANDSSSYSGSGTVWNDISGNNNNFNIVASAYNSTGVKYMDFSGGYGIAKNDANIPLSDATGVTYMVWTRILNSAANWRTLTRTYNSSDDHQVIIVTGGWDIGMYHPPTGFETSGYSQQSLPNYGTSNWVCLFWRFENTSPYYELSYNDTPEIIRGSITNPNSEFTNGFGSIGGYHNSSTNPSDAAQYWGDIGQFLCYNRRLTDAELLQNFNATKAIYGL